MTPSTRPQSPEVAVAQPEGQRDSRERAIGTIRRECLDWLIPVSQAHLRAILKDWRAHYNAVRPHSSLDYRTPIEFRQHHEFINQGAVPK
jgi:transposase InsO family protein